ncbi:MAG: L-arabinose transport system permease protein AraQ [Syntrophomonadaceae bacterium]|nr:L-arabinose transport system permease protein AraQ [Bacillota bacterium]
MKTVASDTVKGFWATKVKSIRVQRMLKLDKLSYSLFRGILIVGIGFIIIYPLLMKLSAAFMHPADMYDATVNWVPRHFTDMNFRVALDEMNYTASFVNTFLLSAGLSLLELLICTIVGYGFARFKFRGSNLLFAMVVLTLLIPPQMIMLPLFLNFRFFTFFGLLEEPGINLIGSPIPLILLAATGMAARNGLFIYVARQFFRGMSVHLEEAAYIDGAGPLKTFFKIMLPNAVPGALVIFVFAFVWRWNDLFYVDLLLRGRRDLLSLSLRWMNDLVVRLEGPAIAGTYVSLVNAAAMLLYIIPLLIFYAFLQRHFIESVERTGMIG